jgi:mannose-6-phosphate isomerase class I
MESIDFNDFEPALVQSPFEGHNSGARRTLVRNPLFSVEVIRLQPATTSALEPRQMQIVACLNGTLCVEDIREVVRLTPGGFCLVPACIPCAKVRTESEATFLRVQAE